MLKTRWSESGWPVKVSDGRWLMAEILGATAAGAAGAAPHPIRTPYLIWFPFRFIGEGVAMVTSCNPITEIQYGPTNQFWPKCWIFFWGGGKPLSLHPITSFQFHHPIPMFLILFSASPSQNFIYTVVILIEFGVIDSTDWMVFQSRPLKEVIGYIQSHWTWSWWVNMDLIPITLIYRLCYERVFVGRGRARA